MTPRNATAPRRLLQLRSESHDTGEFYIRVDTHSVHLVAVYDGDGRRLSIPRRVFNRFVDWYGADQPPPVVKRPKRRK